jgi:hypothetical protein
MQEYIIELNEIEDQKKNRSPDGVSPFLQIKYILTVRRRVDTGLESCLKIHKDNFDNLSKIRELF